MTVHHSYDVAQYDGAQHHHRSEMDEKGPGKLAEDNHLGHRAHTERHCRISVDQSLWAGSGGARSHHVTGWRWGSFAYLRMRT